MEKKYGKWTVTQDENGVWQVPEAANNKSYSYRSLVQSDPICSSAGCPEKKKKGGDEVVYYPDPDAQGLDHDIKISQSNEVVASKITGKDWVFKFD